MSAVGMERVSDFWGLSAHLCPVCEERKESTPLDALFLGGHGCTLCPVLHRPPAVDDAHSGQEPPLFTELGKGKNVKGKQRCFLKKLRRKQNKISPKQEKTEARKWVHSPHTDALC